VALISEIKSSIWHQFVKKEFNLLLKNSWIFAVEKIYLKPVESWGTRARQRAPGEVGKAISAIEKIGPLSDSRLIDFVQFAKFTFSQQ